MVGSIVDNILSGGTSEEASAVNILFGTKDFQRLKMISEVPPNLIYVMAVLGMIQKRYKSTILKQFEEEFLTIQKSRDRKGILELVEIMLGMRKIDEGGED